MATRCLPSTESDSSANSQPPSLSYNNNNPSETSSTIQYYTSNTITTQSWPVINRNLYQYDYETLLYLNNIWKEEDRGATSTEHSPNQSTTIYDNINNQNIMQTQTQTSGACSTPPPVVFLLVTLVMTSSATAILCASIMTDHWEHVTWNKENLEKWVNISHNYKLEWLLDRKVARIALNGKYFELKILLFKRLFAINLSIFTYSYR